MLGEDNKRRTLQRNDIVMAITKHDQIDFLIDMVPRDEVKPANWQDEAFRQQPNLMNGTRASAVLFPIFATTPVRYHNTYNLQRLIKGHSLCRLCLGTCCGSDRRSPANRSVRANNARDYSIGKSMIAKWQCHNFVITASWSELWCLSVTSLDTIINRSPPQNISTRIDQYRPVDPWPILVDPWSISVDLGRSRSISVDPRSILVDLGQNWSMVDLGLFYWYKLSRVLVSRG